MQGASDLPGASEFQASRAPWRTGGRFASGGQLGPIVLSALLSACSVPYGSHAPIVIAPPSSAPVQAPTPAAAAQASAAAVSGTAPVAAAAPVATPASGISSAVLPSIFDPVSVGTAPIATEPIGPVLELGAAIDATVSALFGADPALPARAVLLDPFIDARTGNRSTATRVIEHRLEQKLAAGSSGFRIRPLTAARTEESPWLLIGTLTPVRSDGTFELGTPEPGPYRLCTALIDPATGLVSAHQSVDIDARRIDIRPTAFFEDRPVWWPDIQDGAYARSCAGARVGAPVEALYAGGVAATALIADAVEAYNSRRYVDALNLFESALKLEGGERLNGFDGVYLASRKLGRHKQAGSAFDRLLQEGFARGGFSLPLRFVTGRAQLARVRETGEPYDRWLKPLAGVAASRLGCFEVIGHGAFAPSMTSADLMQRRAAHVAERLGRIEPGLHGRLFARAGAPAEVLVGTGSADSADALDRRIEFRTMDCPV